MRRHGGSIIGAIALLIAAIFAVLYFTKDDAQKVSYTSPAAASAVNGSSKKQENSAKKFAASRAPAASATSKDEGRRLWVIVRDRTGSKQTARVALIRSTGEGTFSQMTGTVGEGGYVTFDQNGQDLVAGSYRLIVSKSLGKSYTRDLHYPVRVKGEATTVRVTYTKLKVKQKTRVVIRCEVSRKAPKAHGGDGVTYRPPSHAPSRPSYTPRPSGGPVSVHTGTKVTAQAHAKTQINERGAGKGGSGQTAVIKQSNNQTIKQSNSSSTKQVASGKNVNQNSNTQQQNAGAQSNSQSGAINQTDVSVDGEKVCANGVCVP